MASFPARRSAFVSAKKFIGWPGALFAVVALLAACHPAAVTVTDPNDPKFVVAAKGSWQITEGELDKEVSDYLKQHQATPEQVGPAKMPMLKTAMLKNMILKKLLLDKAATLPLNQADVDKEVNAQLDQLKAAAAGAAPGGAAAGAAGGGDALEQQLKAAGMSLDDLKGRIREKVLIGKVLDAEAFKNVDPTDQEINDIYLKNKDSFVIPSKVRASRILILADDKTSPADKVAKKKAIDKARQRVMKGEDFSKVATEVSQDRYSAPRGGDINFFQRGENEPGFDDVAFNTKVNTVSPVFQTSLGYQFLKVTAIQPAGIVPIAEARSYITSKLREMKMAQQEQAYASKLLADSGVVYHMVLVDPPAQTAGPNGPGAPDNAPPPQGAAPSDGPAPASTSEPPGASTAAGPAESTPDSSTASASVPSETNSTSGK